MSVVNWEGGRGLPSKQFICGFCGNLIASSIGYAGGGVARTIYLCPHCSEPTYFAGDRRVPGVAPGTEVAALPADVAALYKEARNASASSAYTASVLASRKLLMNIGVSLGAAAGLPFVKYIDFLADKGYVPPNGRTWVDHIRKKGNEATHEIVLMTEADASELIVFAEMLLKFIYEFPSRVPPATPTP